MRKFFIGLDLGQASDYSALSIAERLQGPGAKTPAEPYYHVRHLQRYKLGTSYPAIAAHVKEVMARDELAAGATLIVDQTGVGRPVVDVLRAIGLQPRGITITGGLSMAQDPNTGDYHVPKRDLVSSLQVLL